MNRLKKKVTILFFSIETNDSFFSTFSSAFATSAIEGLKTRVFSSRAKKYLIKLSDICPTSAGLAYPITVVRERNTWQTKATSSGEISGISINQGLIGDPYYFFIVPDMKLIIGFTTGPSGSLKSVGKSALQQFNKDRLNQIKLHLIPKTKEYSSLREIPEYSSLHFKIDSSSLADAPEDAPKLIRNLSSAPYIENGMQLTLDLNISESQDNSLSRESIIEIVNYLSDNEGCSLLKVSGINENGAAIKLDFGNAFVKYVSTINTRKQYINEEKARTALSDALDNRIDSLT